MKKILLLLIFILSSFSLFSCDKTEETPFQTSYKEIFSHFEKKQYLFDTCDTKTYSKKLNDDYQYYLTYNSDLSYNLSIYKMQNIYTYTYNDTFGDIFIIDNVFYFIHFSYSNDVFSTDSLVISSFVDNELIDIFSINSVQAGYVKLIKENDYFYLFYFNSMTNFLCLSQISLEFDLVQSKIISKASYIRSLYIISSSEFYFVDGTTIYYYINKSEDFLEDNKTIKFIASEVTYIYPRDNKLYLYEVKATSYVINTNLILRESLVKHEDDEFNINTREIYNVSYNFRKFDYFCYKNKIFYIFKEFLGIIEYDIVTGIFYGYCNPYEDVENFEFKNDTLFLKLSNKKCYYKLDLLNI